MSNFQEPNGGYFKFRGKKKQHHELWIIVIILIIIAIIIAAKLDLLSRVFGSDKNSNFMAKHSTETTVTNINTKNDIMENETQINHISTHNYPDDAIEFQNHMYCLYDISLSWSEAEKYCIGLGGHLVSINSSEEQQFIESLTEACPKNNIWIGGYLSNNEWKWSDDSSFTYQNWDIDKPDNYKDNEFFLRYANADLVFQTWSANKGKWDDCAENASGDDSDAPLSSFGFVCEWVKT